MYYSLVFLFLHSPYKRLEVHLFKVVGRVMNDTYIPVPDYDKLASESDTDDDAFNNYVFR